MQKQPDHAAGQSVPSRRVIGHTHDMDTLKQKIVTLVKNKMFLSEISDQLGIKVSTIRFWRKNDPDFDADLLEAEEAFVDQIEIEAIRRAKDGVLEPVVSGGRLVTITGDDGNQEPLMLRRYSDNLMQFVLRGRRRTVYGDHTGSEQSSSPDFSGARDSLQRKFENLMPQEDQK